MSTITDFNNSNSQLSDLIAISPSQILYSGSVLSNPSGNIGVQLTQLLLDQILRLVLNWIYHFIYD